MKTLNITKTMLIVSIIITPLMMYTEYLRRGYFALGGEVMLWVIPLAILIRKRTDNE